MNCGDAAMERRDDRGAREIGLGLGQLSLAASRCASCGTPLSRENGELALGLNERRLRRVERSPLLGSGRSLVCCACLRRPGALLEQILRALVLVLGIAQRRLGLRDLERSLVDRRSAGRRSGPRLGRCRPRPGRYCASAYGERVAIVAVVETGERLSGL